MTGTVEIHKLDYQIPLPLVFEQVQILAHPVWLDSGYPAANHGRFDIVSALPATTIQAVSSSRAEMAEFVAAAQSQLDSLGKPAATTAIPFQGGLIGYLGYDLSRETMGLDAQAPGLLPEAHFGLYLWAFIYDHHSQSAQVIFHPNCDSKSRKKILTLIDQLEQAGKRSIDQRHQHSDPFVLKTAFQASSSKPDYLGKIHRIKEYIRAGDVYQVNYAQHFAAEYQGTCAAAYLSQRARHPAPYSSYIGLGKQAILSHSPEEFIQIQGSEIQTQPIKGTAPRAADPKMDKRNAEVLQSSSKDRAENLMIVDLLRNDLGKSCEPGSISVPKLFELQSFSNVHHLVSKIRGRLAKGSKALEVLIGCHPGGSITGAPKRRAMQIIDQLEDSARGVYCGTIGFLSCCGQLSTSIAIRTLVADGEKLHCWGGGGIVADSDAEREYQETLFKVGPIMASLQADYLSQAAKKGQQR